MLSEGMMLANRYEVIDKSVQAECQMCIRQKIIY